MAWLGFVKIGFYEAVSLVDKAMEAGMELFSLFICFHCLVKCLPSPGLPWLPCLVALARNAGVSGLYGRPAV